MAIDKAKNKLDAVRQDLAATPSATGSEISRLMKNQFNLDMNHEFVSTYRYHIQKGARLAAPTMARTRVD
jgi:hypothetical protein